MTSSDNPPPGGGCGKKEKPRATRPDVSLRLKNRKLLTETVVPCSLPGRLGVSFPPECRLLLRQEIDAWVLTVSKVVHRLSLIFNRFLLYHFHNNIPLPKMKTSLFTGMALHGMKHNKKNTKENYLATLNDFCSNEFNVENGLFPRIQRQRGDCQAIVIASKRYETNFKNTIFLPFFTRQKAYIQTWLSVNEITGVKAWEVQKKINRWGRWNDDTMFPPVLMEFIREEQAFFPVDVGEEWLKKNPENVLTYYYRILRYFHSVGEGKKFRLAPLCQIKCHFLTIDNTVLREILSNVRSQCQKNKISFPPDISQMIGEKTMTDEVWKSVFDYSGLRRRRQFGHQVDTNGEKICFHFHVRKKQLHKGKRRVRCKQKKAPRQPIISVDPGRSNLITSWDEDNHQFYRLTRRQYYKSSGMLERNKKSIQRNLEMKGIYDAMSMAPTRSADDKDWYRYQSIVAQHYDKLWAFKTRRVWKKEDLRVYCLKEKCLDRFFNQFQGERKEKPLVVYGASCFHHTGKGEMSVPVKYVYKKCYQKYRTEKENEKYTTLMHHKCKETTRDVRIGSRKIRGLRWCPTCRELVSRDENASINIGISYKSGERPEYLCDTYRRPDRKERERGAITLRCRERISSQAA